MTESPASLGCGDGATWVRPVSLRTGLLAAVIAVAAGLTGCSSPEESATAAQLERDRSAVALLDREHARVYLPTSEYKASRELHHKQSQAYELMIQPCLRAAGYDVPISEESVAEDRIWGLWIVERARRNGFKLESRLAGPVEPETKEYAEIRRRCWEDASIERDRLAGDAPEESLSVAFHVESQAAAAAKQTEEFRQLHERYSDCLKAAGYSTQPDFFGVVEDATVFDEYGKPSEAEIRAAVAEARCNEELDVTQTMGNLEASFSAPLVRERQAELNVEKERLEALERRVDEYLRTHQ